MNDAEQDRAGPRTDRNGHDLNRSGYWVLGEWHYRGDSCWCGYVGDDKEAARG